MRNVFTGTDENANEEMKHKMWNHLGLRYKPEDYGHANRNVHSRSLPDAAPDVSLAPELMAQEKQQKRLRGDQRRKRIKRALEGCWETI